jgi:hypothetical protein
MNPWVELLIEVVEMRQHQKDYFKKKDKLAMAKAKLSEIKVDQLTGKLEEMCREKGIELTNPKKYESTE